MVGMGGGGGVYHLNGDTRIPLVKGSELPAENKMEKQSKKANVRPLGILI